MARELAGGYLRTDVYRDREPVRTPPGFDDWTCRRGVLWQTAISAHDIYMPGVVRTSAGCVLLPAQAGSRQSSVTAALTHLVQDLVRWISRLHSDVLVSRSGRRRSDRVRWWANTSLICRKLLQLRPAVS